MQPSTNDLRGKHAVITGPTAGIGFVTAHALATRGAEVTLVCRSPEKAEPLVAQIAAAGGPAPTVVEMDLASLASVRTAGQRILDRGKAIDLLINNAGIAGYRGQTADGFEIQFGTNHLGHFLFTTLLLPLVADRTGRVVTVASRAHLGAKRIPFEALQQPTKSVSGFPEYQVSKLCNVLFSAELARRVAGRGIHTYSLHPGVIASDIWRRVPWLLRKIMTMRMMTNEQGAQTSLYCATAAACAGETGLYYNKERVAPTSELAQDAALAGLLWARSEAWVKA